MTVRPEDFFDLTEYQHKDIFRSAEYVWDALKNLGSYATERVVPNVHLLPIEDVMVSKTSVIHDGRILKDPFDYSIEHGDLHIECSGERLEGASLVFQGAFILTRQLQIGKGVVIYPGATFLDACILGDRTTVRPGSIIRGPVVTGNSCIIGHATEIKTSILLNQAQAPHKAYVGDSILGNRTNLGSGTSLANFKQKIGGSEVTVTVDGTRYATGMRKLGAIIGDFAETGCGTVCNPGTLLGRGAVIYPCVSARGYYPPGSIVKQRSEVRVIKRDDKGELQKRSGDAEASAAELKALRLEVQRLARIVDYPTEDDLDDIKVGGTDPD